MSSQKMRPPATCELVPVDSRRSMDLALEFSFVLVAKTILSGEFSALHLPLRFDTIFEQYMRLAAIVLSFPELDFQKSSRSLRQFAKGFEKNGFLVLNTGQEEELIGQIPGMVVTEICHNTIDDIYSDHAIFGAGSEYDEMDAIVDTLDVVDDFDSSIEGLACDDPREDQFSCKVARRKNQLLHVMSSLQDLFFREEERLHSLKRKLDKSARKALEKEWRSLNIRSNAEHVRGQRQTKSGSKDKYQTLTHADIDTVAFHAKHSKNRSGMAVLKRMQQIQAGSACGAKRLEDKLRSHRLTIKDNGVVEGRHVCEQQYGSPCFENLSRSIASFAKFDDDFEASSDIRGDKKRNVTREPGTNAAAVNRCSTLAGASLKLQRVHRDLLLMLGFEGCHSLSSLPSFADLRHSYKQVSLKLHPDKVPNVCTDTYKISSSTDRNVSPMTFQEFQEQYQDLLAAFYDVDRHDFNAQVKSHLPRVPKK